MKVSKLCLKGLISFGLAITIASAFSLSSFALNEPVEKPEVLMIIQDSGTLTIQGEATINGNPVQTGATVLTGSQVATGTGSKATIDLGPLGRIVLGANTTVFLTFAPGMVHVKTQCARSEIEVISGRVEIKSPETETLGQGQDKTYSGSVEAMTSGGTDFEITCEDVPPAGGAYIGPGWQGWLSLVGVGAGITTGILVGDEEGAASGSGDPNASMDLP
ncbi:MAG: hypothetical protein L0229_00325 [Blastocatellia bacterium]|nr:hypothetical protein [Blastocatellia bacterium]